MRHVGTGGPRIVKDGEWAAQQREFAQRHCVVFRGFVDDGILGHVPRMLEAGQFCTREDVNKKGEVFARELAMRAGPLLPMFFLQLHQPRLFDAIAEFTGSEEAIQQFQGRCFKILPGGGHFDSWHSDACLFRIHKSLQHRALPVEGTAPRCTYGGWFLAGADYRETLRERMRPLEDQTGSPPELSPQPSG